MRGCFIGIDPGSKNFALSVISGWDCLGSEMIKETLQNLKKGEYDDVMNCYEDKMLNILEVYKPELVIVERFIVRGFSANIIELVGIMIGILRSCCRKLDIPLQLISSGQWKIKIKKHVDLKALYKQYKKSHKTQPHTIDSLFIAKFGQNREQFSPRDVDWIHSVLPNLKLGLSQGQNFRFRFAKSRNIVYN